MREEGEREWPRDAPPPHDGAERAGADPAPLLDVVIPALDEADALPHLLEDLTRLQAPHRVIVADGGSADGTPRCARAGGARVLRSPRGRARQMNAGAAAGDAPWVLFLHADVRMPAAARDALTAWLSAAGPEDFATFAFALEGNQWFWRFIELGQRLRERLSGLAYGDQGVLVSRRLFEAVGGFPDLPVLEDVEFLRALRRVGRWERLAVPLLTSPRRYQEEGRWRTWFRNSSVILLYLLGVPPRRLAHFHPLRRAPVAPAGGPPGEWSEGPSLPGSTLPERGRDAAKGAGGAVLVFAKAPKPGRVKTRLAAEVGDEVAAELYRSLGRQVVDQLRGGAYRLLVFFDPPTARKEVLDWLGGEGIELRPQIQGGLGERLTAAFKDGFSEAEAVVVVGTDAPGVDAALVEDAFARMESADLVLGPAADGGYYLLGLKRPLPSLFRGIPWSSSEVMEVTRARAREEGLVEAILPTLSDVDTLSDWRRLQERIGLLAPPSREWSS